MSKNNSAIKLPHPVVGKENDIFAKPENFRQFWKNLIDKSTNSNLFADKRFQRFIAVLCCYRGAVYFNGILNAVRVADLVQQQLLTPKMTASKAKELPSRREVHLGSIESSADVIFLTEEQQKVEMCIDKLQLIFGPPGTGKTLLLLLQVVKAAQDAESTGKLLIWCKPSYKKKFEAFIKASKQKFAREPIFGAELTVGRRDCDDVFIDELCTDQKGLLEAQIEKRGRTVCVVTNDFYPNNQQSLLENFATLKLHYTTHILLKVMRGTSNIINHWKGSMSGYLKVGHNIAGAPVETPKMCKTIDETLEATLEKVEQLVEKGALPRQIAVITASPTEVVMIREFIVRKSVADKKLAVAGADELQEGAGSVMVDHQSSVLSHEWPFVIVCSLFCIDFEDSFVLIAESRAIAELTIIHRDYKSMQISIESYFHSHFKRPFIEFACFEDGIKSAIKFYLSGGSEIHDFITRLHFCLTVFRLNIYPKSNEKFTDLLESYMQDCTLMDKVAADYMAYFKKSHPHLSYLAITAKKPNNFFGRLLSNIPYTEDDTTVLRTKTYNQFEQMLGLAVFNFCSKNCESHDAVSLPLQRIFPFSENGHAYWNDLLDLMRKILSCWRYSDLA